MELRPIDLLGGFYADDSKPWSVQDTVNWLPEVAEVAGTRTQMKLASPPGLREYMRLGDRPIRGLRNVEGQLFAVCGNDLHQVSTKATSTVRGQIPGVGRVHMAHNQITGGNELLIVNGQSTGYVWNTAKNTYLRITDDGYPGARAADYLDSYLLQVEPFGRFWFHSNLSNALDYNTLDRYESEASPDKIVTLVVSQFEVVVFNETTTEFFYNVGANTSTFQNKRVLIDRGCASGDTVQKLDNSVFWLGNDGVVYRLNGYQAVPISTGPVQAAIRDNNWKQAFAFTWEDGKHKVYYLTFPDGRTWGFDVVTGVWHRRQSFGLERWRLNHLVRWNGMWIGSDFQDGRLWVLDWDYMLEGDQPLVSERIGPVGHNNQMALNVNYAELLMSMGVEQPKAMLGPGPGPDPLLTFRDLLLSYDPDMYLRLSELSGSVAQNETDGTDGVYSGNYQLGQEQLYVTGLTSYRIAAADARVTWPSQAVRPMPDGMSVGAIVRTALITSYNYVVNRDNAGFPVNESFPPGYRFWQFRIGNGILEFIKTRGGIQSSTALSPIGANITAFVVATYSASSGQVVFYVDGLKFPSSNLIEAGVDFGADGVAPVTVGSFSGEYNDARPDQLISEAFIVPRVLSDSEIMALAVVGGFQQEQE
ncbi:packaged DNA stabilization protein [Xanthomonas campestris]|uniref:packaged DNA stabilization protein n=1 Tax=Xanthomonas campestris TaxID=339 RepID=UPI0023679D2A|nr:packaged DNA stabilization protein [Xanthomonas campestris]WDI91925.1 hypothetical protein JH280_11305 [Xanthomonas campestris]